MRNRYFKWAARYWTAHELGKRHVRRRPYLLPILGLVFGLLIVAGVVAAKAGDPSLRPSDSHVVFLFDAKKRITHNTKAKTVGELVKELPLNLIAEDIVEPSLDTPIVEDNFRVNVYRARPVTIIDDNNVKTVTLTAQRSPRSVAEVAGLTVYAEDNPAFVKGDIKEHILGEKMVIDRATPVALNLYGAATTVRTHATTVGELLDEKQVKPAADDTIQPSVDTPLTDNIQVFISRFGLQIATVEETIPAPVQVVSDSSLSLGTNVTRQAGAAGRKSVTYQIQMTNGRETGRIKIQEVIIQSPVPRIVARGTVVAVVGDKAAIMNAAGISPSDHGYANFIISRESNWNPNARNAGGCLGLGQACPGSKLTAVCPDLNAVCQMRFFSGYAHSRYGGWAGAYSAWQAKHWW